MLVRFVLLCSVLAVACESKDATPEASGTSTSGTSTGPGEPADCPAAVSEQECMMPVSGHGRPACAWVDVYAVEDPDGCGLGDPEPRCIAVRYQGEGCSTPQTCGQDGFEVPSIYHRAEDGVAKLIARSFCETQPEGWSPCSWPVVYDTTGGAESGESGDEPPTPAYCECLCP